MIDGRKLYSKLRWCAQMEIKVRVYNDWIRTNTHLVGFLCAVRGKGTKEERLETVKKYIENHQLPVIIEDIPGHQKNFKIVIVK